MDERGNRGRTPSVRGPSGKGSSSDADETLRGDHGGTAGLTKALDEYRAGFKELHEAAADAGIAEWDLLEAAQSTPDPMVAGAKPALSDLPAFIRRRDD